LCKVHSLSFWKFWSQGFYQWQVLLCDIVWYLNQCKMWNYANDRTGFNIKIFTQRFTFRSCIEIVVEK
jgi:hypothetical protein